MTGLTSERSEKLWRSMPVGLARRVLKSSRIHKKFETMNGEAAVTMLRQPLRLPHNPHHWDELWHEAAVRHPARDDWREERNLLPHLKNIDIPAYLGCDWENVPLHLPSTFAAWNALSGNDRGRMGMLGRFGLTWPPGGREFLVLGAGLGRVRASETDPPPILAWDSAPLDADLDVAGDIELLLIASATAIDVACMATLQDAGPDGEVLEVTAGWLRGSMREVDQAASPPGAPVLPCRTPPAIPLGEDVVYRIPLAPRADASSRVTASGWCSPATTRTRQYRRSRTSATPASAPAASTRSGRRRGR
ncbi:CocE/NonD family hydrolase C-terminal non-catalytic domain-containing protein [Mycobacterium servetii]|uniref:CocE/NonD family hydrolase C-terminal non-catalytic domain-containing protein n=1 Tax=Mycobacterium servetii TaxID=3237418 RepID=A0ABV4BW28_9MYCO